MNQLRCCLLVAVSLAAASAAAADEVSLKNGERIYRSKCKSCHGATGEGINAKLAVKKKLDPDTLPLAPMADKTDEEVRKIIVEGVEKMPGFGEKLKEAQIQEVLDYCRKLVPLKAEPAGQ